MEINIYNIREKIFSDISLQKKLYNFKTIFDQWNLSYSIGGMGGRLRFLELELLKLIDDNHKNIISEHFLEEVEIKKIDNNISKNYKLSMNQNLPKEVKEYKEFCVSIDKENIYLTMWR